MRRWLVALTLLLSLTGLAGFGAIHLYRAPGPLPAPRAVMVPRGGLERVGAALRDAGVIRSPLAFRIAALATYRAGPVHAAEFAFPAGASLQQVLAVLRTGRPVQHRLTIPEGLTSAEIAALVAAADALAGDPPVPPEGAVLPQTYDYERGTTRETLLARAHAALLRALDRAWAERDPALPFTGPDQALTLASIVEKETAKPDERPRVAAVFLNRLRLGMKLQSDPTVVYGASGGLGTLDRKLSRADLDRDDAYNTYRNPGLPPGPICNPGIASILAVTRPAQTSDLYFVADGSGGHAFAATLPEHLRNVARYRALEQHPPERAHPGG
ncbi:MAG TPA: endolytic transglycosylase MltG [Acetobacteraceae bacterium]|nr:endolytic transglycosylase MltG [Acetobacteraceae bacterium]